jgi:hypothetical protein
MGRLQHTQFAGQGGQVGAGCLANVGPSAGRLPASRDFEQLCARFAWWQHFLDEFPWALSPASIRQLTSPHRA